MRYILKTNKLLIHSEENPNNAFIYTGSPNEDQKNKGKLIIILDFPESTKNPKELGNLLIQKIHKLYYNSALIEQEAVLENILEELNENLPLITEINNNWLKEFNAIIAIIYRQEVYFSPMGNVSAWVTNNNRLINIFDYLESNIDKPTIDKIFTNVLSGNIEPNQLLFFTTNTIFNYLSKDKIAKIIINNEPAGIALKLKELIYKIQDKNFCSVSIKLTPYKPQASLSQEKEQLPIEEKQLAQQRISKDISPQQSINQLLKSQQVTRDILTKGKSKIDLSIIKQKERSKEKKYISLKKIVKNLYEYLIIYISILIKIVKTIFNFIKKIIQNISKKIQQKKKEKQLKPAGILAPIEKIEKTKILQKLPKRNTILIIAIIILIVFIVSTAITKYKKQLAIKKENYKQLLEDINEKQIEYDLLLIYNDEIQAKEKLQEVSDLIDSLPRKTDEQKQNYQKISDNFTEILNKARKLTTIKEPEFMAEYSFKPVKIVKHGNLLIAAGLNSDQLSKLDLKTKEIKNIEQNDIEYNNVNIFGKVENFLHALDINDKVIKIDLDSNKATEIDITYHPNYKSANDASFYNNRLYLLDNQSNQIYKHNQGTESFNKGEEWIKDNTDIINATSLAIDGNIYVSNNAGQIKKFYTGVLTEFNLEAIDPIIKNIDKIYTDITINEIYILDNTSKRIIIINKDGKLINQFYFPTLSVMNDFVIDGSAQKVYIQSVNKIISLNLK